MKKTNIVFCLDQMIMGGMEKVFMTILLNLLKTQNYNISLIVLTEIKEKYFLDQLKDKINYYYVNTVRPNNFFLRIFWKIKKLLTRNKKIYTLNKHLNNADIIIDFKCGCFNKYLKNIKNKTKIGWAHCSFEHFKKEKWIDLYCYDKIICLTDKFRNDFILENPEFENKIFRIYNPIELDYILTKSNEIENFDKLEKKLIQNNYFVCVSRIADDKDLATLIKAFSKFVNDTNTKTKLYLIGDGPQNALYKQMISRLGMNKHIYLLGKKDNPYPWIKNSQGLILSSLNEGFGMVLAEGLALQTIVISSDCPSGPREILLNGKCGVLVEPGNIEKLKNIFEEIENGKITKEQFSYYLEESLNRFKKDNILTQVESILHQ